MIARQHRENGAPGVSFNPLLLLHWFQKVQQDTADFLGRGFRRPGVPGTVIPERSSPETETAEGGTRPPEVNNTSDQDPSGINRGNVSQIRGSSLKKCAEDEAWEALRTGTVRRRRKKKLSPGGGWKSRTLNCAR